MRSFSGLVERWPHARGEVRNRRGQDSGYFGQTIPGKINWF